MLFLFSFSLRTLAASFRRDFCRAALLASLLAPALGFAGGPKFIAGSNYFDPAAVGTPVHWSSGKIDYYVDQGALSATVSNNAATAMVDTAAALWSNVATAAVVLTDQGALNEDVSGANVQVASKALTAPSDVTASATNYPLAVIYDADGAVIDALFGAYTSEPADCSQNGVYVWLDNIRTDATIAHAAIVLNGRCATSTALVKMMQFNLVRAFGRVLGLDYSQVNPDALTKVVTGGTQGWPVMQPRDGLCTAAGGACIPYPDELHADDVAALGRLYPVTGDNIYSYAAKKLTEHNTVSITGTIHFRTGTGMQGVNVVARPLDANGNPLYQYTVTAVSGKRFRSAHGNRVTGTSDASGVTYDRWGSPDTSLQGVFDLRALPLPPGATSAAYQISFESVDALDINDAAVGPYTLGQVKPSGTLASFTTPVLSGGDAKNYELTIDDSAAGGYSDALGAETTPRALSPSGYWVGRLSQIGQSDWFLFPVRANRTFSVVAQALDESGAPSSAKAMPAIGIWNATDTVGSAPRTYAPALNGAATGESWLHVSTAADGLLRLGIADQRGDGRPDYTYAGWVLYVDSVQPARLPASGGAFVLRGMGFRNSDTVLVGGKAATVTSISPNEITAIAPSSSGVSGSVDVEVDDLPAYNAKAVVTGGISYDAGSGDSLTLVTAPTNTVPTAAPLPFTVTALGSDLKPAPGVTVTFAVASGTAKLGCGNSACAVTASGDGSATMAVTATDSTLAAVTATLANGASLRTEFTGGTPATITALNATLYVAAGATVIWPVQTLVLSNGLPAASQAVAWQSSSNGIAPQGSTAALTSTGGIATKNLMVGPLAAGEQVSIQACVNGTSHCATFTANGARSEYAQLASVAGTAQTVNTAATPDAMLFRLLDMNGHQMAGGTVTVYQALYAWTQPCAAHAVCPLGALLATQTSTATSALDGLVTFSPASLPGTATTLRVLATSGYLSTASATIERHP